MRKRTVFTVAALSAVAGAALIATTVASARPAASAKAAAISCKSTMTIGFVTPLTGGAGFLGQEQLSEVCNQDAPPDARPQGQAGAG